MAIACEVVVVTGASRGIGRAVVRRLCGPEVDRGALRHVVLSARGEEALDEVAAVCRTTASAGLEVHALPCDVADPGAVVDLFAQIRERCGKVDGLVLNAGIADSAQLHRTSDEMFERTMAVNLGGVFRPLREAIPDMLDRGRGRAVAVASIASHAGMSYVSAYCASKHAVLGLVRAAAREYAAKGITVNAVCPGYVDTPMTRDSLASIEAKSGLSQGEALSRILATNPQRRLFSADEVAASICWLLDEMAAGVNGSSVMVDGGELAG